MALTHVRPSLIMFDAPDGCNTNTELFGNVCLKHCFQELSNLEDLCCGQLVAWMVFSICGRKTTTGPEGVASIVGLGAQV